MNWSVAEGWGSWAAERWRLAVNVSSSLVFRKREKMNEDEPNSIKWERKWTFCPQTTGFAPGESLPANLISTDDLLDSFSWISLRPSPIIPFAIIISPDNCNEMCFDLKNNLLLWNKRNTDEKFYIHHALPSKTPFQIFSSVQKKKDKKQTDADGNRGRFKQVQRFYISNKQLQNVCCESLKPGVEPNTVSKSSVVFHCVTKKANC